MTAPKWLKDRDWYNVWVWFVVLTVTGFFAWLTWPFA